MTEQEIHPHIAETPSTSIPHEKPQASNKPEEAQELVEEKFPIKSVDVASEHEFKRKAMERIDSYRQKGGMLVLFDVDGTTISQDPTNQGKPYIREAFADTYHYAKTQGLRIGILTLRSHEAGEIRELEEHDIFHFDEVIGRDTMTRVITENQRDLSDTTLRTETNANILKRIEELEEAFRTSAEVNPIYQRDLLQLVGEYGVQRWNNPKLLYLALRNTDNALLIDDDMFSGAMGEKLGVAVHIPAPEGHTHDK